MFLMSCAVTFGRPSTDGIDVELRAERPHQLEPLLGEAVGHHDQRAVTLRAADERERGPGAAAGVLDDRVAGRDQPVALGPFDHRQGHPVLHRAGRVRVLELQPELGAVRRVRSGQAGRAACSRSLRGSTPWNPPTILVRRGLAKEAALEQAPHGRDDVCWSEARFLGAGANGLLGREREKQRHELGLDLRDEPDAVCERHGHAGDAVLLAVDERLLESMAGYERESLLEQRRVVGQSLQQVAGFEDPQDVLSAGACRRASRREGVQPARAAVLAAAQDDGPDADADEAFPLVVVEPAADRSCVRLRVLCGAARSSGTRSGMGRSLHAPRAGRRREGLRPRAGAAPSVRRARGRSSCRERSRSRRLQVRRGSAHDFPADLVVGQPAVAEDERGVRRDHERRVRDDQVEALALDRLEEAAFAQVQETPLSRALSSAGEARAGSRRSRRRARRAA